MKALLTLEQFISEQIIKDEFKKVCITRREHLDDSFITGSNYHTSGYWIILTKDIEPGDVPKNYPVLNYDRRTLERLLDNGTIKPSQVYNKIEARKSVSSKSEFYKLHSASGYIIPNVTDASKIETLKFPIVAKPDNEHSGLGISVFKDKDEFENADLGKFTSFSEKVNISEEHRYFIWRGEVIQWTQRIPMDKETADIGKKDPNKETNFSYILKNIKNIKSEHLKACRYFANAHSDLDFYAVDLAETEDGKIYVFEMNSEPGALFGVMAIVYQKIYEDYYEQGMSTSAAEMLKKFRKEDSVQNTKQNSIWKIEK
jgi:hypothetical protein